MFRQQDLEKGLGEISNVSEGRIEDILRAQFRSERSERGLFEHGAVSENPKLVD